MPLEIEGVPGDAERAKHFKISARIGAIGIKQRAVPIEQYHSCGKAKAVHRKESYQEIERQGLNPP